MIVLVNKLKENDYEQKFFKANFKTVIRNFEFFSDLEICLVMRVLNKQAFIFLTKQDEDYAFVLNSFTKRLQSNSFEVVIEVFKFFVNFKENKIIETNFKRFLHYRKEKENIQLSVLSFVLEMLKRIKLDRKVVGRYWKWFIPSYNDANKLKTLKTNITSFLLTESNNRAILKRLKYLLEEDNKTTRTAYLSLLKTAITEFKLSNDFIDDFLIKSRDVNDETTIDIITTLLPYLESKEKYIRILTGFSLIRNQELLEKVMDVFLSSTEEFHEEIVTWLSSSFESTDLENTDLNLKLLYFSLKHLKKLTQLKSTEKPTIKELRSIVYNRIVALSFRNNELSIYFKFIIDKILSSEDISHDNFLDSLLTDIVTTDTNQLELEDTNNTFFDYGYCSNDCLKQICKETEKQRKQFLKESRVEETDEQRKKGEDSTMSLLSIIK